MPEPPKFTKNKYLAVEDVEDIINQSLYYKTKKKRQEFEDIQDQVEFCRGYYYGILQEVIIQMQDLEQELKELEEKPRQKLSPEEEQFIHRNFSRVKKALKKHDISFYPDDPYPNNYFTYLGELCDYLSDAIENKAPELKTFKFIVIEELLYQTVPLTFLRFIFNDINDADDFEDSWRDAKDFLDQLSDYKAGRIKEKDMDYNPGETHEYLAKSIKELADILLDLTEGESPPHQRLIQSFKPLMRYRDNIIFREKIKNSLDKGKFIERKVDDLPPEKHAPNYHSKTIGTPARVYKHQ